MASERSFQHIEWYDGYGDVDTHNPLLPAVVEFSTEPWSVHLGANPLVLLQDIIRTRQDSRPFATEVIMGILFRTVKTSQLME